MTINSGSEKPQSQDRGSQSDVKNVGRSSTRVEYDSSNHWQVLTQMNGSVWPKVMKYCIFNVLNTIFVILVNYRYDIDLSFSDRGHTFMSMMVSFLMVTRSNIAYSRYMEARQDLERALCACRELISYAATFTRYDMSPDAQHWRLSLARTTIKALRAMVAALEYQTTDNDVWKIKIFSQMEKKALLEPINRSNERAPILLSSFIRTNIAASREYLEKPLHANKELKLYALVSDFTHSYHALMKLVTTPFPFPLVQMTRTFLFIWIFTLPWVLVEDLEKVSALLFTVFFITYAFVGLEFVAIELDDPFGDDPNDFDILGLAAVTFNDIYVFIFDLDGEEKSKDLHDFILQAGEGPINPEPEEEKKRCCSIFNKSNERLARRARHLRLPSLTAWDIAVAVPKRAEAGFETSQLLLDGESKAEDLAELNFMSVPPRGLNSNEESYSTLPYHPLKQQIDENSSMDYGTTAPHETGGLTNGRNNPHFH